MDGIKVFQKKLWGELTFQDGINFELKKSWTELTILEIFFCSFRPRA